MFFFVTTLPAWKLIVLSDKKFPTAAKYIILPNDEYYSEKPEYIRLPDGRYVLIAAWMEEFPEYVEHFTFVSNPSQDVINEAEKFKVSEEIW